MARLGGLAVATFALAAVALVSASGGCSGSGNTGFIAGGAEGGAPPSGADSSTGPPVLGMLLPSNGDGGGFSLSGDASSVSSACVTGLCRQVPQGCTTSLSGTVYDPAGKTPLYNAVVFVPKDASGSVPPITPGITPGVCNTCDVSIGGFVAVTTTDSRGHFSLSNVPAGMNIPLVVQMGKWRRKAQFIPSVAPCTDTPVPPDMSRLPKSQAEGDMPQMALLTGGCDDLGCFMSSIGIDPTEFSPPGGGGRLDVYIGGDASAQGGPSAPTLSGGRAGTAVDCSSSPCPLWSSKANLEKYDIVILACECGENQPNKPDKTALHDWLAEGGKAFATHYHYTWFKDGPPDFQAVANFTATSDVSAVNGPFKMDVSFPKGAALQDWMGSQSLLNADLSVPLNPPDVKTSMTTVNSPSLRWIYDTTTSNVKYMSFLTPIGGISGGDASTTGADAGPQYCGKAVFTDIHTSGGPSGNVPGDCTPTNLTPQQFALEFLFFDLSSCVQPDTLPPFEPAQ
jgi:hypothetical protein